MVAVFSCSKAVMATVVNLLVEDGRLEPNQPVARYWPEFAAAGKDAITVRQLVSHQAGLPAIEGTFTLEQALSWEPIVEALASSPQWEPGSRHGYHMRSFGWLTEELVRRATGLPPAEAVATMVARPLGLDLWLGMPFAEQARCARLIPPEPTGVDLTDFFGPDSLQARVFTGPSDLFHYDEMWNRSGCRVRCPQSPSPPSIRGCTGMSDDCGRQICGTSPSVSLPNLPGPTSHQHHVVMSSRAVGPTAVVFGLL